MEDFVKKPGTPEELVALKHYGVLGMHWGVRRERARKNRELNRASRKRDRAKAQAADKQFNRRRDNKIDDARRQLSSGASRQSVRDAKAQYKLDRATIGSREARKKLREARAKHYSNQEVARLYKSGAETAGVILGVVGAYSVTMLLRGIATRRATGAAEMVRLARATSIRVPTG